MFYINSKGLNKYLHNECSEASCPRAKMLCFAQLYIQVSYDFLWK